MLDQFLLKKLVRYNPKNGDFIRIAKLSSCHDIFACEPFRPRSITAYGYYQISILRRPYPVHRLIWLYMTGEFPTEDIDHINGDRLDNKWSNLRQVSRGTNLKNIGLRSTNKSGHVGVYLRSDTGKYSAYIHHKGRKHSLGDYTKINDAVTARLKAEIKFGFHRNHGRRKAWTKNPK